MTQREPSRPVPRRGRGRHAAARARPSGGDSSIGNQRVQRALGTASAAAAHRVSDPSEADEREANDLSRRSGTVPGAARSVADRPDLAWGAQGRPLAPADRSALQAQFGTDLSAVRLHTDAAAAAQAESLHADAATRGNHIAFGPGQYRPDTPQGAELLRHEVAHAVQASRPGAPAKTYRQPKGDKLIQGLKPVYFKHMRDLLLNTPNTSADTRALVGQIDLTRTTPQTVKVATVGGKTHTFRLLLSFDRKVGATTSPANSASTPADTTDYAISIGYDFNQHIQQLPSSDPYFKVAKPGLKGEAQHQYQRAWPMAEILYHELQHLQILIDRDIAALDPNASFSEAFKEYVVTRNYLQEIAKKPRGSFDAPAVNALAAIPSLVERMCRDIPAPNTPTPPQILELKRTAIGFFVQEKYAFWKTAAAFSGPPNNALIAHSYAANHFAAVLGGAKLGVATYNNLMTTRVRPVGFFGLFAQELETCLTRLFDYLDKELLHAGQAHPR